MYICCGVAKLIKKINNNIKLHTIGHVKKIAQSQRNQNTINNNIKSVFCFIFTSTLQIC